MKKIEKIATFVLAFWVAFSLYLATGGIWKIYHPHNDYGEIFFRINKVTGTVQRYNPSLHKWKEF